MDAVVLVGGEGTRLRPLTYDIPKQMLPVVDRPMIEHVVAWLAAYGISRAVLSLGYRADAFVEAYPDGQLAGTRLEYAVEPEPLDTAGAIRFASQAAGVEGAFVVVNADVLTDFDLASLIAFHAERGAEATIQLTPVPDPSAFGVVPTDAEGRVERFIEKPPRDEAPTNLINAGCYVLEPSVVDQVPGGRRVSVERETFPLLAERGTLFAMASDAYWLDTGTAETYLQASIDILRGLRTDTSRPRAEERSHGIFTAPGAVLDGDVTSASYIGRGAWVESGAVVTDSVISEGATIAEGASVSASIVMDGAHIGAGCVVDGSIIGPRSTVGPRSRVTLHSIVGCRSEVATGTELTAARFPER